MTHGAFSFVLHSHLPYARLAGRWPHGEEWIHEAASETYLPLLETLYDLKEDGVSFQLTLGITPVLAEQLRDKTVLKNLDAYLDMRIAAAEGDIRDFEPAQTDVDEENTASEEAMKKAHLYYLAHWYREFYLRIKRLFNERFERDIVGAFKQLQDEGYIEIIASAATHGYLPLLNRDSAVRAQIEVGIRTYERLFGRVPTAFWLPECAYRPAYVDENGVTHRGIESVLADYGIKVFFSETHTITGGQPVGVATGDVVGPYGDINQRYVIPVSQVHPQRDMTTFRPYYVSDSSAGEDATEHSGVAVLGRNERTGQQVWSADWGYPGDFDYREFHRKAGSSGLQYWRVTGDPVGLENKEYYHPEWASFKVEQHAENFAHLVGDLLREYHQEHNSQYGILTASFDTELFGHWWFEGVDWLGAVLRHLAQYDEVDLLGASNIIERQPPEETLHLPESSWGAGGVHFTWDNAETHWMWDPIHRSEARMETLANSHQAAAANSDVEIVLAQAARELLLMESSDWSFLVTTNQAKAYAIQRFNQHLERFEALADSVEAGTPNVTLAHEFYERDKLFADIDFRVYATDAR